MWEEFRALAKNDNWETCESSNRKKGAGCKWIFVAKHKPNGTIAIFKTTFIPKGIT